MNEFLTLSTTPDINYLAQIVKLKEIEKHPNADKLQVADVSGQKVITGLDAQVGDIYVYFSVESKISEKYLCWSNSYSDAERNKDITKKGFFHKSSRVKMVRLRQIYSEGYIVPFSDLQDYIKENYGQILEFNEKLVGYSFDTICGERFVEKYVRQGRQANNPSSKSKGNVKKYATKLVENQFRFHEDTLNFKKALYKISPDDVIVIQNKIHGCNFLVSNLLIKKKLTWRDKLAKWFGVKIYETEYGNLYASRTVIKNSRFELPGSSGYYDHDIWKIVNDRSFPLLDQGITITGEIYGFTPSGKAIQPKYDYGCPHGQLDFIVFKVTYTSPSGEVYVFSHEQTVDFCNKKGFKMAETFYHGIAKDLFPELDTTDRWHENFLEKLSERYLEKKCWLCKNDVFAEGVIIRRDIPFIWDALKLKSLAFLNFESGQLDSTELSAEELE